MTTVESSSCRYGGGADYGRDDVNFIVTDSEGETTLDMRRLGIPCMTAV